jgi:RNA polymerase sigma-70 factor (ECF subfamily)
MIQFLPRLRRFAYALTGDWDRGDDLVQETCLRALSRVHQFDPDTSLESWMFRIAQNIWIDQGRAAKTRGTTVDVEEVAHLSSSDGRSVTESRLTLEAVSQAIAKLPNDLQVLIALTCIDGRSYQEAADIVGAPIGTVMSRLARARRKLHELLGEPRAPADSLAGGRHG